MAARYFQKMMIRSVVVLWLWLLFSGGPAGSHQELASADTVFHPQYYLLKDMLGYYRSQAEKEKDVLAVIPDSILFPWMNKSRKEMIRSKLIAAGDLAPLYPVPDGPDSALVFAIKRFQRRHGIPVTGVTDEQTLHALDISFKSRVRHIEINMERWKSIPRNAWKKCLFVNAANFELMVFENDTVLLRMRVVIGRTYRRTPVFNSRLNYIVFNPGWTIPPNILRKDILPLVMKDSSYLVTKGIRVFRKDADGKRVLIHPDSLDWNLLKGDAIPYEFVQLPGPDNAMGVVKFMFPNKYNVYMHDTPAKELFMEDEPVFSSGCIRLSRALDLAAYLLRNEKGWSRSRINAVVRGGETQTVYLKEPVETYIQYFTCWVDENGYIHFRKDIYGRDIIPETEGFGGK